MELSRILTVQAVCVFSWCTQYGRHKEREEFNPGLMNKSNDDLTSHRYRDKGVPSLVIYALIMDFHWAAVTFIDETQKLFMVF